MIDQMYIMHIYICVYSYTRYSTKNNAIHL